MESNKFLEKRIELIENAISDIEIIYTFEEVHREHILEVTPEYLDERSEFEKYEIQLYEDFIHIYPNEILCIKPKI